MSDVQANRVLTISPSISTFDGVEHTLWGCPSIVGVGYLAGLWGLNYNETYQRLAQLAESNLDFTLSEDALLTEALAWSLRKLSLPTKSEAYDGVPRIIIFEGHLLNSVPRDVTIAELLAIYPETQILHIGPLINEQAGDPFGGTGIDVGKFHFDIKSEGLPTHCEPHVHVQYGYERGNSGTFYIRTGEMKEGRFSKSSIVRKAKEIILEHQQLLINYWNNRNPQIRCDLDADLGVLQVDINPNNRVNCARTAKERAQHKYPF